jgi:hypothetical protein
VSIASQLKDFSHVAYSIIWDSIPARSRDEKSPGCLIATEINQILNAPVTGFLTASDMGLDKRTVGVTVNIEEIREARARINERLPSFLILELDSFFEINIRQIARIKGIPKATALERKALLLALASDWQVPKYKWAYVRTLELFAVRNCIAHGSKTWTAKSVAYLKSEMPSSICAPEKDDPIDVSLRAFLIFKSAVRTVLNHCS